MSTNEFNNLYSVYPLDNRADEWNQSSQHEYESRRFQNSGSSHSNSTDSEPATLKSSKQETPRRSLPFYGMSL